MVDSGTCHPNLPSRLFFFISAFFLLFNSFDSITLYFNIYLYLGSLLAAPLWAAFILADDPAVAALCLLGEYLTAECWFGPTLASLFSVVPKNRRGVYASIYLFVHSYIHSV